jgi:hypothetical protein
LLDRKIVPLYFEDSFHSLAMRVYTTEIAMLCDAAAMDFAKVKGESLEDDRYKAHGRMPVQLEQVMMARFDRLRRNAPSCWGEGGVI